MNALQLHVDPFDVDFDQTRRQDLELEKPPKKKKPAVTSDDDTTDTPTLGTDLDTEEDLDEDDKPADLGDDDEPEEEV